MKYLPEPGFAAFRDEARTWLASHVPSEPRPHDHSAAIREWDATWQREQFDGGWAGVDWAVEHGGRGLSLIEQIIWNEEAARAGAPAKSVFSVAVSHAGPTLIRRGSEEQKAFHLPRILRGESPWSQGFSEPGAGSDLAALTTRGVIDGDHLVVNGQKTWTTAAEFSDYAELLVRTDPSQERHRGLTWIIADMSLPGIDIRPIMSIDGYPHNAEVFYDDVRIPLENVVGGIDNGWSVAMSTLAAERGPGFMLQRMSVVEQVDQLVAYARERGLLGDDAVAARLGEARALVAALRSMAYYQASAATAGVDPGPETTAVRTFFVETEMYVSALAHDLVAAGDVALTDAARHWLSTFYVPIAGGTIDIQRNILGERVLGLPR